MIRKAAYWGLFTLPSKKNFCVTGTVSVSREDLRVFLKELGLTLQGSVSSSTDFLIVPDGKHDIRSAKYQAAMRNGTYIMSETEFCNMILPISSLVS